MVEVPLTQGRVAKVCECHLNLVKNYKWSVSSGYVVARSKNGHVKMHRLITQAPKGKLVDHENHDKLDNRCSNLRVCTSAENMANRVRNKTNSSGYKGVFFDKTMNRRKRWAAMIRVNEKNLRLGRYLTPEEAAIAYNDTAIKYRGAFAMLNKIERIVPSA